jgi:hypothetical protein
MSLRLPFIFLIFLPTISVGQTNIVTANYDNFRTNANTNETTLSPSTVGPGFFGKQGTFAVDGPIYTQPLYVSGVNIPDKGAKNVVYVATMNDSVYAIDGDAPSATKPLWRVHLGNPVPSVKLPEFVDVPLNVGILSTPVIDLGRQAIYVVSDTLQSGSPVFQLHALSLADGSELFNGPVVIAASVPGSGAGSVSGTVSFDAMWELQRPGLALANGMVYIAFASHGDTGPFHGWLISYDSANLRHQVAAFNTTPDGIGGGIWQSGRAPTVDDSGNIYVVSGNGDFDGQTNLSGAVIKLSGSDLSVLDWYTPAEWQYLDANDLDVGSTGAIVVPGSNLLVAGDKGGRLINLNASALGHIEAAPGANEFAASPHAGIFQLSLWQSEQGPLLYEHDWHGPLKAYPVNSGSISRTPFSQGTWTGDSLYQGMAVSSSGGTNGILWETTGDHSQAGIPGTLHAFNAADLTQELWNSDLQPYDSLGGFAKFAVPLVANGRVFVPTLSNRLAIYGLLQGPSGDELKPHLSSVLNGASLIQQSVSPGELLTILGTNLGPNDAASFQMESGGRVSTELSGTQVFFGGVAAPVLYTSFGRVDVLVPFVVAKPSTQLVVQHGGRRSAGISMPVSDAAPALFSVSRL